MMADQIQKVIHENEKIIVKFYRPECPSCQYIEPLFQQLMDNYSDKVTFTSVDITDRADLLKEKYNFSTVPTVIYFRHGEPIARHGSNDKTITYEQMEEILHDVYDV